MADAGKTSGADPFCPYVKRIEGTELRGQQLGREILILAIPFGGVRATMKSLGRSP
jgi:hypothetical protein